MESRFKELAKRHHFKYVPACRTAGAWLVNEANDRIVAEAEGKVVGWYKSSPHIELKRREILAFLKGK
jgi:hypothetical protein